MFFIKTDSALIGRKGNETLKIEAYGENAFRVRSTMNTDFSGSFHGLTERKESKDSAEISIIEKEFSTGDGSFIKDSEASITNGTIHAEVSAQGIITFYRGSTKILREYYRNYFGTLSGESRCLKVINREYKGLAGNDWRLSVRFESNDEEKLFGMGQYQQSYLDLKGCTLELAQRNSQVSIPFALSSLGYGFLWNNPAVGKAVFGRNMTEWTALDTDEMDYWITVGDSPAEIERNYTEVTGRTPLVNSDLLGLWQCKLRYRTQDEVLSVAREYYKRGIHIDVIVIDFFHWLYQGDWSFDKKYWPDVKGMCEELHAMGIKVMVSVWPSVDKKSRNFSALSGKGCLVRTERGANQTYDYMGDCMTLDTFNPEARKFLYQQLKNNYRDLGIDYFWMDNAEPDYAVYDYENYRYFEGPALKVGNEYPKHYAQTIYEGLASEGEKGFVSLIRSAWVGSQKYAILLWSGDVPSTFESFRDQVIAGLNAGIAGIPLWNTDIGGFMTDDVNDPYFRELLIRWYEFAVFSPFFRMHGDRGPYTIPNLDDRDFGGGFQHTGQPNELWSYGEENYEIMKKYLGIREGMKDYIAGLVEEAHLTGAPIMRTMFWEFPNDPVCWTLSDQYMFGRRYLVAPVLACGAVERDVYLPEGSWKNTATGELFSGKQKITAAAPLDIMPVFELLG